MKRNEYIERVTGWLMPDDTDPELANDARATGEPLYTGSSERIARLVRRAYLRGIRRGASCAYEAMQPVTIRTEDGES